MAKVPMGLSLCVHRLERLSGRCGVDVVRHALRNDVMGRLEERRIVLRAGLTCEQQLLTLVHELTHLLVHCNVRPAINRTVCEYEAEAVEQWVGTALGIAPYGGDACDLDAITDGLLTCSVKRVKWTALLLIKIAQGEPLLRSTALEPQPAIQFNAAPGEEIIFNNELRGMRDFIRLAQPL